MNRKFNVIIENDSEGYLVASVPSRHTQAKSLDQLMERIQEAIELMKELADFAASMGRRSARPTPLTNRRSARPTNLPAV